MLVSEIISLADDQCEGSYTVDQWLALFNWCQDDLTPVAKILTPVSGISVTVTSTKTSITIANNADLATAHEIVNVYYTPASGTEVFMRRIDQRDNYSKGWKLDATKLYLQGLGTEATGSVRVDYYKKLTHVTYDAGTEVYTPTTPEIPSEYHGLYVSYLCGKSQQREEENEDMSIFMAEYNKAKADFELDRVKQMEPWRYQEYLAIKQAQAQQGGG